MKKNIKGVVNVSFLIIILIFVILGIVINIVFLGSILFSMSHTIGKTIDEDWDRISTNECEIGNSQYHWVKMRVSQDYDVKCFDLVNKTFEKIDCQEENKYEEGAECNTKSYTKPMNQYNFRKCPLDRVKEVCKQK